MKKLTTLLFDVDGTLAETEEIHRQAFNRAFEEAGLDWHWSQDLYTRLLKVTGGRERLRHFIETQQPGFEAPGELDEFIAGLHIAKTKIYTDTVASGQVPMRPGIARLLQEARREGLRLAIATTTTPANVTALLKYNLAPDAESWFDFIGAGNVVPEKKPAPDIYHHVMQNLGVDVDECLAFEDTENGLRSARGAGVPTVVTVSQYSQGQDFSDALLVLDQLGEPGEPFRVLAGDAGDHSYVDVDLLRALRARAG